MYVRSFIKCPLCGKEMRLTSPVWYYKTGVRMISLVCKDCELKIDQFAKWPEEQDEQVKYSVMKDRLYKRLFANGAQKCGEAL